MHDTAINTVNTMNINIYVGNLSPYINEDELRKEFIVFGEVESITIIDDKCIGSGQQRRFAYVEMASRSEGEIAIVNLQRKRIRDTVINVIRALPLSNKHRISFLNIRSNSQFNKERKKKINHRSNICNTSARSTFFK